MEDTIAAIATALGEAALSVIRVSGPDAITVAGRCFVSAGSASQPLAQAPSHTVHYGHVTHEGRIVDEVLLTLMRAPRTFTREDVVEIACHGGPVPAQCVLNAVLAAGARMAGPGEFTRRAFLNGRIDLSQAEAVMDLIHSRTQLAMEAASEQLAGKLSRHVNAVRDDLMRTLAHVEAYIDFPEEDISPETSEALATSMERAKAAVERLLSTADEGRILRRGIRATIIGRPNAGKSSLLNQLLGLDRAIVSPVPGTTRDTIEETANVHGIPVVFVDTAGLRDPGDALEAEGIRRARESLERAELILHVLDASEPPSGVDAAFLNELRGKKRILVRNKTDLPSKLPADIETDAPVVNISCATGTGIDELRDTIKQLFWAGEIKADALEIMINSRHQDALRRAHEALDRALAEHRSGGTPELVAEDLRLAVNAIGEISGKTATEDLLDIIFAQFCIGK